MNKITEFKVGDKIKASLPVYGKLRTTHLAREYTIELVTPNFALLSFDTSKIKWVLLEDLRIWRTI